MKAIDLFAGIGGFHYACKENDIEVIWASEIDKFAAEQYKLNHGLKPQGDITLIKAEDIPKHDLLCAGFPCQSFSLAGQKKGLEDTRGTLFYEIARILEYHHTPYFLLENVQNLISHDKGKTFNIISKVFQDLGYFLKVKVLNAADYGLPQSRKRVFIVGFKDKEKMFAFQFPCSVPLRIRVKDILQGQDEVDEKHFIKNPKMFRYIQKKVNKESQFKGCTIDNDIAGCLVARQYASWNGNYVSSIPKLIGGKNKSRQGEKIIDTEGVFPPIGTGSYEFISTQNPKRVAEALAGTPLGGIQGYRVYDSDNTGISLCAIGGGFAKTGLYEIDDRNAFGRIRKLTPRECARLQGFSEEYKIECSDSQAYKQFGNSVAVPVVSAIIKKLLEIV